MTEERLAKWEDHFANVRDGLATELLGWSYGAQKGGQELLAEVRRLQAENAQIRQVMDGLMEIASHAMTPKVTPSDIIRFHNSGRVPE